MSDTVPPRQASLNPIRKAMAYLSVYSGLALVPLLFVGMYLNLNSPWFDYIFISHLVLLSAAVITTLVFFWRCAHRAELSIILSLGSFLVFLLVIGLEASHPITSRDALIHHLAVPKWWLEAGKIVPISWHEWSFYPMLLQLGFTGLMKHGLVQWTSLYHGCFLLLLCGVVSSFTLFKTQSYNAAVLAFLFSLTLPVSVRLAASPLVDLGLALYMAQALCHLVYWTEGKQKKLHLLVAGACLGLALSCKYNAILACVVAVLVAPIYAQRAKISFAALFSILFVCGSTALLVYFPWLLRNATWTNNPFYPLFNSWFAAAQGVSSGGGLSPLAQRILLYHESFIDILTIPLQMLFLGQDGNPALFDGVLSPILLCSLVPLYRARKEPWVVFLFLYCALYLVLALFLSSARVRYLAPIFGPALVLSAVGVWLLAKAWKGRFERETYLVAASVAILWSGWHAGTMLASSQAFEYLETGETAPQYLRRKISEYPTIEYVNSQVPDTSTVYLLNTGNRFYYFNKRVFSSGHFSSSQIVRWIHQASNAEFLVAEFKNRGIDYLMTNTDLTRQSLFDVLSEEERAVWADFEARHLQLLYVNGPFSVWKINESLKP